MDRAGIINNNNDQSDGIEAGETAYAIGIGILWDENIHGKYPEHLKDKWIVMDTISEINVNLNSSINELVNFYKYNMRQMVSTVNANLIHSNHPVYPNYHNILKNEKYLTIDIFEMKCLPTFEIIGVKKTYWIRMIQRRWKKLYKERLNIIQKRKNPVAIKYYQLHGKWGHGLSYMPSIRDIINF